MAKPSPNLSRATHTFAETRKKKRPLLEDLQASAVALSSDVSAFLAESVEELSTHHHEFKSGLQRAFHRVLTLACRREQSVLVFEEAIPGFTLMLFKLNAADEKWDKNAVGATVPEVSGPEERAAGMVVDQFVARTGNRVLMVESPDAIFVFFPASDIKKNLKEMGYYHTG